MTEKDLIEAVPIDRVKCFMEVKFENNGWSIPPVAAVKEVSCVNKVISNIPAKNEASLVIAD